MSDTQEIRVKIADWQRKYNIPDGDPAMALIELLDIYGYRNGAPSEPTAPAGPVSIAGLDDALIEQLRSQLLPAVERVGFQNQELKQKLDGMELEKFSEQISSYHEGIDYCTKKLDVVKRESEMLVVQLAKVANSISPITRLAVLVLMLVSALVGYVLAVAIS